MYKPIMTRVSNQNIVSCLFLPNFSVVSRQRQFYNCSTQGIIIPCCISKNFLCFAPHRCTLHLMNVAHSIYSCQLSVILTQLLYFQGSCVLPTLCNFVHRQFHISCFILIIPAVKAT